MGISPHLGVSGVHCTMRAIVLVFLAVAVCGEADPYTTGRAAGGVSYTNVGAKAGFPFAHHRGYSMHPAVYGKREAVAEAKPYTMGQVYAGLPVANAIATGHPHNVGVITNMVSPVHHSVHHPYMGYGFYG